MMPETPEQRARRGSILTLHSLAAGLYGFEVAQTVLKIASLGAETQFSLDKAHPNNVGVDPAAYSDVIGQFLRLTMPSLYSRRPPLEDDEIDEIFAIFKIPRLDGDEFQAKAKELRAKLDAATGRFKGWNVQDTNPYAIVHGTNERLWGIAPLPMSEEVASSTFESLEWSSPWKVDRYLFEGLTRCTVGNWRDPCPVGLAELETILDAAGDDLGIRQWVLELGPFNVAKMVPDDDSLRFEAVATSQTIGGRDD